MKKILILLFLTSLASGCAFTRSETPINYSPSLPPDMNFIGEPSVTLEVGKIIDERLLADPTIVFHKRNLYGTKTTGYYAAQKPVCDIFRKGLIDALKKANFNIVDANGHYVLQGELKEFDSDVHMGWITGTIIPKMIVKFELLDGESGKQIWKEVIFGKGTIEVSAETSDKKIIKQCFSLVMDDVVSELIGDPTFQDAFQP